MKRKIEDFSKSNQFYINPDCSKILEKAKLNNNTITNNYREDGTGEQYKLVLFTILFAEYHNLKFVFTPIKSNEHNYNNEPNYLKEIDNNIGINQLFEENKDIEQDPDEGRISDFCYWNLDKLIKLPILDKIRTNFFKNKKYSDYFDIKYTNIGIHIRRGNKRDSSFDNKLLKLQIDLYPDDFYIKLIRTIINSNKNLERPIKIHIYSQDLNKEYFKAYDEYIEYHLNENLNDTFNALTLCDTYFMAPSTLSYIIGFFRNKNTIFLEYYHMPIEDWIIMLKDGEMMIINEKSWKLIRNLKYSLKPFIRNL